MNYICISKDFFNKMLINGCEISEEQHEIIQNLKRVRTFIDLSDAEIEILEKSNSIMLDKLDKLEDFIDDENNQFYNHE